VYTVPGRSGNHAFCTWPPNRVGFTAGVGAANACDPKAAATLVAAAMLSVLRISISSLVVCVLRERWGRHHGQVA
jgi:hypothetical protein